MAHYLFVLLTLGFALASAHAAEDEFVILIIDDNLIGPIQPIGERIDNAQQAMRLISAYHQLLPTRVQIEVTSLHEQMLRYISGFEVAYTSADSAEFSHLMDEIDLRLTAIKDIHSLKYTQEVIGLLSKAYQLILPTFGDERQLER